MEDWQNSSLEEKVDLDNLVLFPPDSYPIAGISELRSGIKEEKSEEDNDVIENHDHNDIKTENFEFVDTRFFEFSTNGAEICQTSGLEFENKDVLKLHNLLVHPEETKIDQNIDVLYKELKKFNCNICDYKFTRKFDLRKHIENVHEGMKPFKCNTCDYETSRNDCLKKHIESVHEGTKAFKCNICKYETAQKPSLGRHIKSVHEGIKPFKCSICNFDKFMKEGSLSNVKFKH